MWRAARGGAGQESEEPTIFLSTKVQEGQASQPHPRCPAGVYFPQGRPSPAAEGTAGIRSGALRRENRAAGLYPLLVRAKQVTVRARSTSQRERFLKGAPAFQTSGSGGRVGPVLLWRRGGPRTAGRGALQEPCAARLCACSAVHLLFRGPRHPGRGASTRSTCQKSPLLPAHGPSQAALLTITEALPGKCQRATLLLATRAGASEAAAIRGDLPPG